MKIEEDILRDLSDFASWNEGKSPDHRISLFDYACFNATPDSLLGIMELLHPSLIIYKNSHFLEAKFDEEVYGLWSEKGLDSVAIEKIMNHVHLTTIFQSQDIDYPLARFVAEKIVFFWSSGFQNIDVIGEVSGETIEGLAITLYTKSNLKVL